MSSLALCTFLILMLVSRTVSESAEDAASESGSAYFLEPQRFSRLAQTCEDNALQWPGYSVVRSMLEKITFAACV